MNFSYRCAKSVLAVAVCSISCADEGADQPAAASVRDSAGIEIVENVRPTWASGMEWSIAPQPVAQIGGIEGDPNHELFHVTGAVRLSDGRIVVANAGTELRYYDSTGAFLETRGREGAGPDEYRGIRWIQWLPGDTIAIEDSQQRRLSILSPDGSIVRATYPVASEASVFTTAVFGDGTMLSRAGIDAPDLSTGLVRFDQSLFRHDEDGTEIEHVGFFSGDETYIETMERGFAFAPAVFGRSTFVAVYDTLLYVAANDTYEIREYSASGELFRLIRRQVNADPVTDDELEQDLEGRLAEARSENGRRQIERLFRAMPKPADKPRFNNMLVDKLGHLWVQNYPTPNQAAEWSVFRDGIWLGDVTFPIGFQPFEVGPDYVVGRSTDELDVQRVQVFRIGKPSNPQGGQS